MFDPIIRTVWQMMTRFGGDSTLIVQGPTVYDPVTSTSVTADESFVVRTIVFDYIQKSNGIGTGVNDLIQSGDKQMFLKPLVGIPTPKARADIVLYQNTKYNIVTVKEINPSGNNVILYELFIRQ